jgi:RimJ/RimL family protein N-acetyltransferase
MIDKLRNYWQGTLIRLRAVEPSDAENFFRWDQDSERAHNLDFLWPPTSKVHSIAYAEEASKRKFENDTYQWIIENRAGEAVGAIDTHHCNPRDGTLSYALDVAPEHRRKGYASEAILMVLRYYFEELRYQKANIPVHSDNPESIRLHEKLGFHQEGAQRRMMFTRGVYVDLYWFGMTNDEFWDRYGKSSV